MKDLIKEFKEIIISNADDDASETNLDSDPLSLVGSHISHKFVDEHSGEETWYEGFILGYNTATKMHEVAYVEEVNSCYFNLTVVTST